MKLQISNVVFGNNTLGPGWLDVRTSLRSLTLSDCHIDAFHNDAFSAPQFANLEKLYLKGLTLRTLQAAAFRPLRHVTSLSLDDCLALQEVDSHVTDMLHKLTSLQVLRTINRSNRHVLPAFAGSVSTDAIVDLQFNKLGALRREDLGAAATSAASLYLSSSGIKDVLVGTFPPSRFRQLLTLSDNNLTTLENMSISFENRHPSFSIFLERNPWNCDCSLLWLLPYVSTFADSPLCSSPQHFLNWKLTSALVQLKESCTLSSTTVSPSTDPGTTVPWATSEPTATSTGLSTVTAPNTSEELTVTDDVPKLPTTSSESNTHYSTSEAPSTTHSVTDTTECSTTSELTGTSESPTTETTSNTSDEVTVPGNTSELPVTSSEISTHYNTSVAPSTTSTATDSTVTTEKIPTSVPPDEKPDDLKPCYRVELSIQHAVDAWSKDSVHIHDVDEFTLKILLPYNVAGGFLVWRSMDSPECFETSPLTSSPVVMEKLKPETDYNICVLRSEETRTSIHNCHSHRTMAEYSKLTWISNGDRTFVVGMTILGSCGMIVLTVLVTRRLLWRYPTLIFKEVLEVGKTTVINRRRKPSTRRFSLPYWWPPPPPPPPRRQSSTQSIGSGSYISVPPPSPVQLLAHFLGRSSNSVRRMFRRQETVDCQNSSFPSTRPTRSESCWSTCPSNYSVSTNSTNTFPSEDLTNIEDIYAARQ